MEEEAHATLNNRMLIVAWDSYYEEDSVAEKSEQTQRPIVIARQLHDRAHAESYTTAIQSHARASMSLHAHHTADHCEFEKNDSSTVETMSLKRWQCQ
jgi:hypothetical protein